MRHSLATIFFLLTVLLTAGAQTPRHKISPWLRTLEGRETVCAFVRINGDADDVLARYGCKSLAQEGNIHIAAIPLAEMNRMAADERVARIEARPSGEILCDTMAHIINALPVYEGKNLPQAYMGKGVVIGVMDIGFDLTHPTFYSKDLSDYRIKRLWDMLSLDTIGSQFYVGRDYTDREELLALQHSRDGETQTHGTHTAGIAAGTGYDSPYRGMAPESDICLVANATSNNAALIDSSLYDRFTFATDALGFKYLFDYAKSVGKPCVVSFSEGGGQDFHGYDQLYYEMLEAMVGPGRILVVAAGNKGQEKSWFRKERGRESAGSFFYGSKTRYCTFTSKDEFTMRFVVYDEAAYDTLVVPTSEVTSRPDSLLRLLLPTVDSLEVMAYRSCYDDEQICYDVMFYEKSRVVGLPVPISFEVMGREADVEFWNGNMTLTTNYLNPLLCDGETSHNILSPGSAPAAICVGMTTHRDGYVNYDGETVFSPSGEKGKKSMYSSVGPTYDGRMKPDVVAPGAKIRLAHSSFHYEKASKDNPMKNIVAFSSFNGRQYPWSVDGGTSYAAPAVAGTIALWLQARPTLTPAEAMDAIAHTSRHCDPDLDYPNNLYGYGEIDAYRGLLYLLGLDGIDGISAEQTKAKLSLTGEGQLSITFPESAALSAAPLRISFYSISGQLLARHQLPIGQQQYLVSLPSLRSGEVFLVQLDGTPSLCGSMLMRAK